MAAGRWDLRLADDTPQRILDELDPATGGYGQLLVLDAPIDPTVGAATLRSLARWSGIFRRREGLTLEGAGLAILLGDEDDKGPVLDTAVTRSAGTLSQWLDDLLPANGIDTGTVTNTGTNVTASFQYVTVRQAIAAVCDAAGAEWRIEPDLTVDAAAPGTLHTSYTTPTAVVTRRGSGRRGPVFGIDPVTLAVATDVEDYTTKVHYIARDTGDGPVTVSTATAVSVPYYYPGGGGTLRMERVIDATDASSTNAADLAAAQLARFGSADRAVTLTSAEHELPAQVRPGGRLWCYDPALGLVDVANQVVRGGETLFPVALRVHAITWPFRAGLGVYFVTPESSPVVVDLSPYYVAEEQTTTLEVGLASRSVSTGATLGSTSVFGDVPLASVIPGTYTPTLTATGSNPTLGTGGFASGTFSVDAAGWVSAKGRVVFGSSGTAAGSGTYAIALPVACDANYPIGLVHLYYPGLGQYIRTVWSASASTAYFVDDSVGPVTAASPHAPAANAYFVFELHYKRG